MTYGNDDYINGGPFWKSLNEQDGEYPRLEWICAGELIVPDDSYQREGRKIQDLVDTWEDGKCGPLEGSRRVPGGPVYITEGGRRTRAARTISHQKMLPVFVSWSLGEQDEAGRFLAANNKVKLTSWDLWDGNEVYKTDPMYVGIRKVLDELNLGIAKNGDHANCVSAVEALVYVAKNYGHETLYTTLSLCKDAFVGQPSPFRGEVVRGLGTFLHRNRPDARKRAGLDVDFDMERVKKTLDKNTLPTWIVLAKARCSTDGTKNKAMWLSRLFAENYNSNLRIHSKRALPLSEKFFGEDDEV